MTRLASVLAAFALAAVLGTVALAIAVSVRDRPAPEATSPAWQVVHGAHGSFEVPPVTAGWTVEGPEVTIFYTDDAGLPSVGVSGPATYDAGYCEDTDAPSNRAFAGHVEGVEEGTRLGAWVRAVGGSDATVWQTPVRLADGTDATRTSAVVREPDGPCAAPRVRLDLVSWDGASFVLLRDLGAPGALGRAAAARILTSLTSR